MDIKEVKDAIEALKKGLEEGLDAKAAAAFAKAIKDLESELKAIKKTGEDITEIKTELKGLKDEAKANQDIMDQFAVAMKNGAFGGDAEKPKSLSEHLGAFITGLKEKITGAKQIQTDVGRQVLDIKAVQDMTTVGNLTGAIPITYRNEIIPQPYEMIHLRQLISVTPSETDSYHFYRHQVGEGTIAFQAGENNTKAQIDEDLTEQSITLDYLAGWMRISKKMLRNFSALRALLVRWLPERYYQREDVVGVTYLLTLIGTSTQTTGNILNRIILTMASQKQAKETVNGIVVNGNTWGQLLTVTGTGSGEYTLPNVVTISPTGQVMILGVPVYTASWVPANTALVGDWRMFELVQSEALSLNFYEQDGTNVRENKITALIEASIGFALLRVASIIKVDTTPEV